MATKNRTAAVAMADKTSDAYMADNYGKSWVACANLLLDRGYSPEETEAILRSKHMRWADDSQGRGNGHQTNSAAFKRYLDYHESRGRIWREVEVGQLVNETF
jgi:hypothetical protein